MGQIAAAHELRTWERWLRLIYADLGAVQAHQQMWHGYREMIKDNRGIQSPGSFHAWLATSHATAQAVAIRREADTDDDVVSLGRLLVRVQQHAELLSRGRYVGLMGKGFESEAHHWFDELAGEGAASVPASIPENDLNELRAKVDGIRRYVNKRVAHRDSADFEAFPTYSDIDDCLSHLFAVYRKYHLLIMGIAMHSEVILQPWEAIFRRRWIQDGPAAPEIAERLAIRAFAKLSPEDQRELRRLLAGTARVGTDTMRLLFERDESRDLAEVLLALDGDELLRETVLRVLTLMHGPES